MNKDIDKYIIIKIKTSIFKNIDSNDFTFFLFGSRVLWIAKEKSDYDIWFISNNWKEMKPSILSKIQDDFDNIPALIDLIDFSEVSESFKNEAMKKVLYLNKKTIEN